MSVTPVGSPNPIQNAIASAARRTGVDFAYLIGQAQVESGMRADARAATSSATGLYQFIDQSWLGVMKRHGGEHGLGWAADSIRQTPGGRYVVDDPATRRAILDLRKNPQVASLMAAEHAADNKAVLEGTLGRGASGTDLYMAHFLGIGGAKSFLSAMQDNPDRSAASMFPAAARANRSIFFEGNGQPRSLADIYSRFAAKLDRGAAAAGATGLASGGVAPPSMPQLEPGVEVIMGNAAAGGSEDLWLQTTLANLNVVGGQRGTPVATAQLGTQLGQPGYRPLPETARLAYMMLAQLGA
ncbi:MULTISPECIES: flagellar biosynthesis protein FlgJ [unclassified Sphingomonas]|uniref:flagellar biosynthesis protein FlgJ n=1 Tax=unclassified Sphingomonas TaxID=196159 RepID=UPI00083095CD|nr:MULTISPECIES: flagellar biosynthesis protein FlgJ [unclassified Sphingomonas]